MGNPQGDVKEGRGVIRQVRGKTDVPESKRNVTVASNYLEMEHTKLPGTRGLAKALRERVALDLQPRNLNENDTVSDQLWTSFLIPNQRL
jgi:hypothetical protein